MAMTVVAGSALVAFAIVLLVWSIFVRGASRTRQSHRARKALMLDRSTPVDLREALLERTARERVVRPGAEALARRVRRFTPAGMVKALEHRIALAGAESTWPIERTLAAKLVLGGVGFVLGALSLAASRSLGGLLFASGVTAVGYFAPDMLVYHKAVERQQRIQQELADTLDQITISVEAGLGFEGAVARAAASNEGPLHQELTRMLQDVRMGIPRPQALRAVLSRTNTRDLRNFVHAVLQSEQYGIPIAQILRVQSSEVRERRRQHAEEAAMKVPVKIVMPLMLCILPALFIVLIGPAALRVAEGGLGG
jgi:tight adherence protein C